MAETPSYNYLDIQRYLQRTMSSQEMHEFEKALMNDPFLADALEGFSSSEESLAKRHLHQIETALTGEQQKAKVVPLSVQKTAWGRVAAAILLIVSGGAITYSVLHNKSLNTKTVQITASSSPRGAIEKESIRPAEKTLARVDVFKKSQSPFPKSSSAFIPPKPRPAVVINKTDSEVAEKSEEKNEVNTPIANSPAVASTPATKDLYDEASVLRRVTARDESNRNMVAQSEEPLLRASRMMSAKAKFVSSDTNKTFTSKTIDSLQNVLTSAQAKETRKKINKSDSTDNKIVTNEGDLSLSEAVVTAKRKMNENAGPTIRADSSNSATPIEGWMNYQQYLHQQSEVIQEIDKHEHSNKEIELEFFVDQQGKPTNIKALTKMDKKAAEKIVGIIANGPLWENSKKDKKVKVIIKLH